MNEDLLRLQISEQAEIAYGSLGPEDRRLIDSWFDHLRNWRGDEFIRSKSRRLESEGEVYAFQTSTGLVIVFEIAGDAVIVLSIFRAELLRSFEAAAGRSAP